VTSRDADITPAHALQVAATVRSKGAAKVLDVTLSALGRVHRGEVDECTLSHAEAAAVLVHVQDLRRDLGAAKAHIGRLLEGQEAKTRAQFTAMREEMDEWIAKGHTLIRRLG
jgi:hypothetical protein